MKNQKITITIVLMLFSVIVMAQTGSVKGKIETADGLPAESVSIGLKGTNKGTVSNYKGEYEIKNIAPGNYTLVTSFVGLEKTEQSIEVKSGETTNLPTISLKENAQKLKEVTVSAERAKRYNDTISSLSMRTETKLIETAQTIQIVGKDVIKDQQAQTLNEVTKNVAGVSSVSPFAEFIFRGFTTWNSTMYDGVNGAYYPYNVQAPTFNVENVEFLKGPASVLYSTGRPGGLINLNTKKPLDYNRYEVNLTYGSWNEMIAQFDLTGALTKNKKFCYRLVTSGTSAESFRAFQTNKNLFIAPTFSYKFNDKSLFILSYNYFYQKQAPGYDNGTIVRMKPDSTWDWKGMPVNFSAQSPKDKTIDWGHAADITFKHNFNKNIKLTFINRYTYGYSEAFNHTASYEDPAFSNDTINRYYFSWKYLSTNYQSSLYIAFKFNTWKLKHQLLIGADYSIYSNPWLHQRGTQAPSFDINHPDYSLDKPEEYNYFSPFLFDDYSYTYQTKGGYIQEQLEINKYLKISGGFRYDDYKFDYQYSYYDYTSDLSKQTEGDTIKAHAIVPKAGIVFNPWKNIAFYGSYSESFEPQWINKISQGGPFPPTLGKTYEVGYKGDFLKDKLSTSVSLYNIDYLNVLVQDPTDSDGVRYISIKGMNSRGVEVSVQGNITEDLQIILNYAYNKVVYFDSTSAWKKDDRQLNTPNTIIGGFVNYKFSKTRLKGLGVNIGVHHESDRVASWSNQKFVTPAYTYYDTGLNYKIKWVTINVNIINLFNVKYITGGYVTGLVYPGTPRSFRIGLNYVFQ